MDLLKIAEGLVDLIEKVSNTPLAISLSVLVCLVIYSLWKLSTYTFKYVLKKQVCFSELKATATYYKSMHEGIPFKDAKELIDKETEGCE